jgi:hypothetical protein
LLEELLERENELPSFEVKPQGSRNLLLGAVSWGLFVGPPQEAGFQIDPKRYFAEL